MARYGMTVPLPGIPLHAHEDWLKGMLDVGYTDFWTSEANGHDGFTRMGEASADSGQVSRDLVAGLIHQSRRPPPVLANQDRLNPIRHEFRGMGSALQQ